MEELRGTINKLPHSDNLLRNVFMAAYGFAAVVAVVFIIYGAVMFTTSAGDAGRIHKGKTTLIYAVVGLIVVLLAAAITAFVIDTVGV